MKNEELTNSVRYYIFKHNPSLPDEDTIKYRESTGSWVDDFDKAMLWADYGFAVKKAKELKKIEYQWDKDYQYVIGQVKISINGMFPMEVV